MPNNSLAHQPLEYTGPENSFVFETLSSSNSKQGQTKTIIGLDPLVKFSSLDQLDDYLHTNPQITQNPMAGIAGYIDYEGDLEFCLYNHIEVSAVKPIIHSASDLEPSKKPVKIIAPPKNNFIEAIKNCQEYIKQGDLYQANLSQKFIIHDFQGSPLELYGQLKLCNPAPYAGYMNCSNQEIISSSPESFLKIKHIEGKWLITSSPIKGTVKSSQSSELTCSPKEQAEHIMIVDLIRNDLGKISQTGSVRVDNFLTNHQFKNLNHLISSVSGVLVQDHINPKINQPIFSNIFSACFPGGSITGAPKKRAMEIIKELEPCSRGAYTGCMGYYKFSGEGEFSILIRTIVFDKKTQSYSFHSGAGITSSSDPQKELEEIYLKAEKLAEALGANIHDNPAD
jgi:para-aminobenzoate synthetase component I